MFSVIEEKTVGARLTVTNPDGSTMEFPVYNRVTVGRHPINTIKLTDREVSKEHAVIERVDGEYVLKDLGSSNGTFVNNRRTRETKLRNGDTVALGSTRIVFQLASGRQPRASGVTVIHSTGAQVLASVRAETIDSTKDFRPADEVTDMIALKADYEKLRRAHEFHRRIGETRDVRAVLRKVLELAFEMLKADNGVVLTADEMSGELHTDPDLVMQRNGTGDEIVLSDTVLNEVKQKRAGVLIFDALIDSRFKAAESIVSQGIRSAMAVPLLAGGQNLKGILFLDSRQRTRAFQQKDLEILSGIAGQAGELLQVAELERRMEEQKRLRDNLKRYLAEEFLESVANTASEALREQETEITVLFSDVRGFTTLSENSDPKEIVDMLRGHFDAMSGTIFQNKGLLDKFIGDCVMAFWGALPPTPDHAYLAFTTALQMQREADRFNEELKKKNRPPLTIGIGIHTGRAVVGLMGSKRRPEYTAIGDSVNLSSRLCSIAKAGEILVSEAARDAAGDGFDYQPLALTQVKGREKKVALYRLLGFSEESTTAKLL
jgi:adenylate cyclase